ncbi:restriction endonuclease subunit S, partial [Campylobacter sp.]|uniref:restriction endonuclease subunit S n=1 Tax=Campylobacter sp. TaxID=205 RepID=UPI00259D092F
GVSFDNRWTLGQETLMNFPIVYPLLSEQQKIADFLDEKCSEIDRLITKKEKLIEELETYKKSLIYEYVTGKKEVI